MGRLLYSVFKINVNVFKSLTSVEFYKSGLGFIFSMFKGIKNTIGAVNGAIFDLVVGIFSGVGSEIYEVGVNMALSLFDGLKTMGGKIKGWFNGLIPDWAPDFIKGGSANTQLENLSRNLSITSPNQGLSRESISSIRNNSSQAISNNVNIEQHVTQASNAPRQIANATGSALGRMMPNRAQLQADAVTP